MKETIIMIHGFWLGKWCWKNYIDFFSKKGFRCVPLVLRYHDIVPCKEPHPALGTVRVTDYLADLLQDIKKLKLKKPPLIMGHSFGSLLTQMIATKIKIKGFILLTPVPPGGICIWKPSVIRIFAEVIAKWAFWRKPFRFTYRTAVFGLMKLLPPEKRKRYYNNLLHESGRAGVETGFYFFDPNKTAFVDRTRIKGPGLIIAAKKDRMMPASLARKTLKRYKDVIDIEYREYPNHAHWIMDEPGWQKVAQDIYDWIVKILKKDKRKKQVPSG